MTIAIRIKEKQHGVPDVLVGDLVVCSMDVSR